MRQPNTADQLQTGSQTGEIRNWARITSFTSVKKSSLSKRLLNPKPTQGFPHTVDNGCGGFDIDWQNSTGNVVQPSVERQRTCWAHVSLSRICYLSSDIIRCSMFVYIHLNALWWTLSGLRAQTSNSGNSKQVPPRLMKWLFKSPLNGPLRLIWNRLPSPFTCMCEHICMASLPAVAACFRVTQCGELNPPDASAVII